MRNDPQRPFGARDKFGYLFGDLGNDFTFVLSTTILMKFYTDVMGVSAAVVGAVMMLARFVDAFTDVAMGRICDRSPVTTMGKCKPWILRMCGPVALASFLMYQSSLANMAMGLKIAYLLVTYILWGSVFYTAVNIPYGSMASGISPDPGHRQSLSTYRTMGGTLAGAAIGVVVPLLAYQKVEGQETLVGSRVTVIAGVFSLLAVGSYLLCCRLTTERVHQPQTERKAVSTAQMLKNALRSRALISVIAASIVMLLAQLTMQGMAGYVYPQYYNSAAAQSASTVLMMVAMGIAAAAAKPLAARLGKAELAAGASFFAVAVCLVTWLLRPQNVWVFTGLQTLCWLGLGMFSMVSWALITDVIDDAQLKNGVREDGSVYALYSFARKLGQAAAAGLSGALLSLIGYTEATKNDPQVLEGVFDIATVVPAIGFAALGLILWLWYPLHKKQVEGNVKALEQLRK